jgi:hypothetical protein
MKKSYVILSLLFITGFAAHGQNAATPNAGFETWTHTVSTVAYDDATGWNDLNSTTAGFGAVTCYKATAAGDFHGGAAAVKLVTTSVLGTNANGIVTTGTINTGTQAITGGIAYTGRPDSIVGWYKSTPGSSDHGFMQILLTGSSNTDTIGFVRFNCTLTAVPAYVRFSAPVWYKSTNSVTTAQWLLSSSKGASGQQVGTTLFVDDLDLIFNATGIKEQELASGFHVGPNPATVSLSIFNTNQTRAHIEFYEITGRKVASYPVNESTNQIDTGNMSAGSYLYTIFNEQGTPLNNGKIIVQK